jgi:hypothetical protein
LPAGGRLTCPERRRRLRDELLDRELFLSLRQTQVVLDQWRMDSNHRRPHGGLKWLTPAAFVAGLDDTTSGAVMNLEAAILSFAPEDTAVMHVRHVRLIPIKRR